MARMRRLFAALALMVLATAASPPGAQVALREVTMVDISRPIKPSMGFDGASTRRLDVMVWYPALADGTPTPGSLRPLVIYSHGTLGAPDESPYLVNELVRAGYIVAAPTFPLTSRASFAKIRMPDISDVAEQVKDVKFVITQMLTDPLLGPLIDPDRVAIMGHSLGGVTSYFALYGQGLRDERVKAAVLIAPGDPVQTAIANNMGLWGTGHVPASVPVLFLTAEKDVFARTTGRPRAAWSRVEGPKYELMIRRGTHVWFHGGDNPAIANRNPDCLFFDRAMPGHAMPGCEERVPLIGEARQQDITRTAVRRFLDGHLKGDPKSVTALKAMGKGDAGVDLDFE